MSHHPRATLLKPTAVNQILGEARALQAQGRKVVSLMRGEPDFPTPAHIVEAAIRSLKAGRTTYPDNRGEIALREAVVHKLSQVNGLAFDPASEILITDGATLGVYAALMTLLGPGDDILLPDPIYDAYQSPIRLSGARARPVKSSFVNGRFGITRAALEEAWTPETKALLLNTPWNPVGTVFTEAELRIVVEFVEHRDITLISDEIYESITYDDHRHVSPVSLSNSVRERCVIVNSFSKTYAMTGWRLGYCAAPKSTIDSMLLILQQSSRGPATFIQDAGVAALAGPQECVDSMREAYAERRLAVTEALSGLPHVRVLPPEGGFFTMADVRQLGIPSNEIRRRLLNNHGLVVMHGSAYGESGEGTLRISFASGGDTLVNGLTLLRSGLSSL